jgi:hypothetical protein
MVDVNFNVFVSFWNNLESIESQIRRTFLKFISTITNNFIMEIVKKHNTICFCYVSYTCIICSDTDISWMEMMEISSNCR